MLTSNYLDCFRKQYSVFRKEYSQFKNTCTVSELLTSDSKKHTREVQKFSEH